ncbi:MAG: helix-turn-helix domain-containing protein [Candidatus Sumerlaeota bacterium]|nr:helix-turn-helix domain-containing protein [Candidatus Sumerlaeota bacterium]
MSQPDLITVQELAELLRVNPRTVLRFVDQKEIPAIRIGRQWRFRREWVMRWLDHNTINSEKEKKAV